MKWHKGRQSTCEYMKMLLWSFRIWKVGSDAYILKYKADTILPRHTDPVIAGRHYRLNLGWGDSRFVVKTAIVRGKVGKFTFCLFRPDLQEHMMFIMGDTIKLSLGFVKFD